MAQADDSAPRKTTTYKRFEGMASQNERYNTKPDEMFWLENIMRVSPKRLHSVPGPTGSLQVFPTNPVPPPPNPNLVCDCPTNGQVGTITYDGSTQPGGVSIKVLIGSTTSDYTGVVALYVPAQNAIALLQYIHQPLDDSDFGPNNLIDSVNITLVPGDVIILRQGSAVPNSYMLWVNGVSVFLGALDLPDINITNSCSEFVTFPVNNPII